MNPPKLTDLDRVLNAALSGERDGILPSLGFTDAVMAAVLSAAPAPLRFPWKRALPGLIAGVAALAGFAGADLWILERLPATAHATSVLDLWPALVPLLQRAASPESAWTALALLIPVVSLWLTRRFLLSR